MDVLDIADLKRLARRRVPRMFFDYADSGSYSEHTYRRNEADFADIGLRQRVGRKLHNRSLASTMVGEPVSMPVALAPAGIAGMQRADGEILAARAAEAFGVPFTLSTMSVCSIEQVAEHTKQPFWFQLYMMKDRGFIDALIRRAHDVGCSALMVTLDLQLVGQRHKDLRNGLATPLRMGLRSLLQLAVRPRWCAAMLGTQNRRLGNIVGHAPGAADLTRMSLWVERQFDLEFCWDDIAWIRERWDRKLILKGVMDREDAIMAASTGADAVVVSNHGGRQLDGAPSTISVLPRIVDAVGGRIEIHLDGGIRSGQDVFRARALGAHATYIGRPYLYGLGAMGQAGVTRALEIIAAELDTTMALCGERDIASVGRHNIDGEGAHLPALRRPAFAEAPRR